MERHVADVGAAVVEARHRELVGEDALHLAWAVVGHDDAPPDRIAVLGRQVHEAVELITATLRCKLGERVPDVGR